MTVVAFSLGITFWTLSEYLLHRFLGHVHKGRNLFKTEHLEHHSKLNYFAPAYKKALIALIVSLSLFGLLGLLMPYTIVLAFIAGFVGMYGLYETTHFRFHAKDPVAMPFIILRKHHFYHHFHDPKMNFGVTTRFWDRIFGTFKIVEKVTVPSRMPLQWLIEDDTVKSAYALHFQLTSHQQRSSEGKY